MTYKKSVVYIHLSMYLELLNKITILTKHRTYLCCSQHSQHGDLLHFLLVQKFLAFFQLLSFLGSSILEPDFYLEQERDTVKTERKYPMFHDKFMSPF